MAVWFLNITTNTNAAQVVMPLVGNVCDFYHPSDRNWTDVVTIEAIGRIVSKFPLFGRMNMCVRFASKCNFIMNYSTALICMFIEKSSVTTSATKSKFILSKSNLAHSFPIRSISPIWKHNLTRWTVSSFAKRSHLNWTNIMRPDFNFHYCFRLSAESSKNQCFPWSEETLLSMVVRVNVSDPFSASATTFQAK